MGDEIFGPVQSRRLGLSLGINHLPQKICTYSCVYCQLGFTRQMRIRRQNYSDPQSITKLTELRLNELSRQGMIPDTITLVPNGEPTLDKRIPEIIHELKSFRIPVAVITNASLLWMEEVMQQLSQADIVSVKIDTVNDKVWHRINRPHRSLVLEKILKGIIEFSKNFSGRLITETMLVNGLNDQPQSAKSLSQYLSQVDAVQSYISLPLRPPAEDHIIPPDRHTIEEFFEILTRADLNPFLLSDLPESQFIGEESSITELLSILKVHPLEETEFLHILRKNNIPVSKIQDLILEGVIIKNKSVNKVFFLFNHSRNN
ncbi:MAG TPA: radical SAM protein [Pelolinea sp.]|nr:radical SAM protein [Pelolinea sp.]